MVDSDCESCTSEGSRESDWFDVHIPTGYKCGQLIVACIQPYDVQVHIPCPDQGDRSRIWVQIPPTVIPSIAEAIKKGIIPSAADIGLKGSLSDTSSVEHDSVSGTVPPLPVQVGIVSVTQGTTVPETQGTVVPESVPETQGTVVPESVHKTQETVVPKTQVEDASVDSADALLEKVDIIFCCSTPKFNTGLLSAMPLNLFVPGVSSCMMKVLLLLLLLLLILLLLLLLLLLL
jgi:hypothetical protein